MQHRLGSVQPSQLMVPVIWGDPQFFGAQNTSESALSSESGEKRFDLGDSDRGIFAIFDTCYSE
jgi:hypothetical protein